MALQSQLFRNDPKLEAAAVSDPAHVLPNAAGLHVGKIQVALLHLDGAVIDADELQRMVYGPSTARAVLAYKQKRNIINRSYQTQADNIVGKMTIAALDGEMLGREPLSGPTRIKPMVPTRNLPAAAGAARPPGAPLVAFKIGADLGFQGGPQIIIPDGPRIPSLFMELPVGGIGSFQVINGKGGTVGCADNQIAVVSDPAEPQAYSGTMPVFKDPHPFSVKAGNTPGKTAIVATNKSRMGFGDMLTLVVQAQLPAREVTIAFHFLGGPAGVATKRDKASIASAVATMNDIYQAQTKITFRVVVPGGAPLVVPELASKTQLVFLQRERTPDWKAVTKNRSATAHFNVFFAGKIDVFDAGPFAGRAVALTDTPGKPGFLNRDCVVQDELKGIDLGLTLAHEAGHALAEDDNSVPGHLMNAAAPGKTIPADAAGRMNNHANTLSKP